MAVDITGMDEIERAITSKLRNFSDNEEEMLIAGERVIHQAVRESLPVSHRNSGHARDDMVTSRVTEENGRKVIKTGWGRDSRWRVKFFEYGTIFQPAQGVIQNAMARSKKGMFDEMLRVGKGGF